MAVNVLSVQLFYIGPWKKTQALEILTLVPESRALFGLFGRLGVGSRSLLGKLVVCFFVPVWKNY